MSGRVGKYQKHCSCCQKLTPLLFLGNGDMASDSNSSRSGGIGFVGLLTILFIGLKLTGHIQWSWLWVLSPIWIMAIVVVVLLLMVVAVTILEARRR